MGKLSRAEIQSIKKKLKEVMKILREISAGLKLDESRIVSVIQKPGVFPPPDGPGCNLPPAPCHKLEKPAQVFVRPVEEIHVTAADYIEGIENIEKWIRSLFDSLGK